MPTCNYCDAHYWFGGVTSEGRHFCNSECQRNGNLLSVAEQLPPEAVASYIATMQNAVCPVCHGPGPIEVHTSYRVYSFVVMTRWSNQPRISCRRCATKAQLRDMFVSSTFGWWGLPWGVIMTPIQVGRNFSGLMSKRLGGKPSPLFVKLMKLNLASHYVAQKRSQPAQATA